MAEGWLQIAIFCAVLIALTKPLGIYIANLFTGRRVFLTPVLGPVERGALRLLRVGREPDSDGQDWKAYARSVLIFSVFSWLALYLILRTQGIQPFNPEGFHSAPWDVNFNTASSFVTNTNWQYYGGETRLPYFAQMAGLAVQNFVSAAVGIAVLGALIRGIVARSGRELGNFWQDLVRLTLYLLLPVSIIGALFLVSQGAIQNLSDYSVIHTLSGGTQILGQGPVASQEVIKELGNNGGGFFNVNSAFPFESSSGLTNFTEMLWMLIIPAAQTSTYGRMVGSQRQGWAIFSAMFVLFVIGVIVVYIAEQHGTAAPHAAGVHTTAFHGSTG